MEVRLRFCSHWRFVCLAPQFGVHEGLDAVEFGVFSDFCFDTLTFPGWNGEDLVPATVLQSLLGGGGSFSTGGPGKGMHSRLFTQVLNRQGWIESCIGFNNVYADSGLFGIYGTVQPGRMSAASSLNGASRMIGEIILDQFRNCKDFGEVELQRAKNALKSSVFMNLETNSVAMDDLGRQVLMSDRVASGEDFARIIDEVQAADLRRACKNMLILGLNDNSNKLHLRKTIINTKRAFVI